MIQHTITYMCLVLNLKPSTGNLQEGIRNRTGRTEPNRVILEPAETGRGTEPNRTGPNHDAFKKRRPNCIEPEKQMSELIFENYGTETNQTGSVPSILNPANRNHEN